VGVGPRKEEDEKGMDGRGYNGKAQPHKEKEREKWVRRRKTEGGEGRGEGKRSVSFAPTVVFKSRCLWDPQADSSVPGARGCKSDECAHADYVVKTLSTTKSENVLELTSRDDARLQYTVSDLRN